MSRLPALDEAAAEVLDAWLFTSTYFEVERRDAALQLLARRPEIANTDHHGAPLLSHALDTIGVEGDLGRRSRELAERLLLGGADLDARRDDGDTMMIAAARFARLPALEFLARHGARADLTDDRGWGPLHWIAALIEHPADPISDELRARPRRAAALLLDAGAAVDPRDHDGKTPLHLAAFLGNDGTTDLLLARGADIDARDHDGYSVLGACILRVEETPDHPCFAAPHEVTATRRVIALLRSAGARDLRPG